MLLRSYLANGLPLPEMKDGNYLIEPQDIIKLVGNNKYVHCNTYPIKTVCSFECKFEKLLYFQIL